MVSLANLTLGRRISLLVLVGLVIGLGLFSWVGLQASNESTQRILDERLTIARVMASHLDETLAYVQLQLRDVSLSEELSTGEAFISEANALRETLDKSGISTRNIILIGSEGRIVQTEPRNSTVIGVDMSKYDEVRQVLETGLPTISGLVSDPLTEVPIVFAIAPILNGEGNVTGALIGSIDLEQSTNGAFRPTITVGETGYSEIVDGNGFVLSRTEPGFPPEVFERSDHPARFAELISQQKATVGTCHRCHETKEELKRRRDLLAFAPLSQTSWGVAIRQSEEEALAPTRQLEQRLLFLGIIVVISIFLLLWTMMQGIVKPIRMLTSATKRVAAGDFKAVIPIKRKDEIGELSTAFYAMAQELASSRHELVSRNEELSALNSITATVGQSLNLEDVLENALQKVLEVTRTTAGCVFLRDSDGNKLEIMSSIGSSSVFNCTESGSPTANCACYQVLRSGRTSMIDHVSQCPMLDKSEVMEEGISCFVSVPLKSKNSTLGIMNVACSRDYYFTENDFRLLDSMGYHVGLALENSVLYERVKEREKLRGQLLSSVITAQEEERKRIARELHDEYGQTLTGLIMSVESLENMILPQQAQLLKEKLKDVKTRAVHALEEMRRLTVDLRPSTLDDLGLVTTIRSYVQTHLEATGIRVDFERKGVTKRLAPAVETALFRIIQEAIHNITKHAEAQNVIIRLEVKANKIAAIVEDDGKGFDVKAIFRSKTGMRSLGLLGIQERATLLGGTFNIKSRVGHGTRLIVEIPIVDSLEESDPVKER